jgi:phosphatidylinositol glycan class V
VVERLSACSSGRSLNVIRVLGANRVHVPRSLLCFSLMAELMPEIRVGKSLARSSDHKYLLFWASVAVRCWTWVLVALMSNLPLFDSSPAVLLPDSGKLVTTLLRWDAFHFAHIARKGYEFEYQWAFFPGLPYLMRWTGRLLPGSNNSDLSWEVTLTGGSMFVITLVTSHTLYELSMHHLKSQRLAFLTCLLSLLPTSPPTLYMAPYNEPVFTFLSYKGAATASRCSAAPKMYIFQACCIALASDGGLRE